MDIRSRLVRTGFREDERTGAISPPIHPSATYRHPALGESTGFDYARTANPTRSLLEADFAALEEGNAGFAFASGMAAMSAVFALFESGDHILASDDLYGGSFRLFDKVLSRSGISASYFDPLIPGHAEQLFRDTTKAVFIESPSNPMMKIADIRALARLAHERSAILIVDNTFMTPYYQRPLSLGADVVIHSGTKYLAGHNDVLCGLVAVKGSELAERVGFIQNATGGVLSPMDSWLVMRGMKTLAVRLDRAQENAGFIAGWLDAHAKVREVLYPGRGPQADLHALQASGNGAMISFRVADAELARSVIARVRLVSFAESLGGVESLITYPCVQTHADIPLAMREKLGITDTLLRLSVGIESVEDIIADLDSALG